MNIFIAGGGRVGFHLARLLSTERQDVTVIETNPYEIEQIDYVLDVSTVSGDATSAMLLQSIGVDAADLFVSLTGSDEINLIAAATAKGLGAKQVVARVDGPTYIESHVLYEGILGIDYVVSPDSLAAAEIADFLLEPGVVASQEFGRGRIQMRQIRVSTAPCEGGKTLRDLVPPGTGVLLGLVNRNGASHIPHGDSVIERGDHVTLIGRRDQMDAVQKLFLGEPAKPKRVAIMGGATIGFRLAQAMEDKVRTVKLFERREKRSEQLAAKLDKVKVICRDATSRGALEQEHISAFDAFVAATNDDERNIMAGVLAKEVGAKMVVSVVHHPDFAALVERLGIDLAITPRTCMANQVLTLVHQDHVTSLRVLAEGQIEVVEFEAKKGGPLVGRKLKEYPSKFPRSALIAAILRGDQVIVPGGDDAVRAGDSVIVIASAESLAAVRKLFQKKQ